MSVLTTLIQHSVRSLSQCNKARNGNKNHNKKRTKTSLFAYNIENPKKLTKQNKKP